MLKKLKILLLVLVFLLALGAGVLYTGLIGVAADEPHAGVTRWLLATVREQAIQARAAEIVVPDLSDPALIAEGAVHYDAMCVACHLAPGMENTELRRGLNPRPPNLAEHGVHDPAEAFWVIKHGIRMTGMPAWGLTHDDRSLWGIVAFTRQLPGLDAAGYRALTAGGQAHEHAGDAHAQAAAEQPAADREEPETGHQHENGHHH